MRRLRPILFALGAAATLAGLVWIGQGLGHMRWPHGAAMIGSAEWARRGSWLAAAGLATILIARRLR